LHRRLDVSNESGKAIDKKHFSLNPGLTIEKVLLNGTEIHRSGTFIWLISPD
jgi:hypothetical protein